MSLNDVRMQVIEHKGHSVHRTLCIEVPTKWHTPKARFCRVSRKFAKPAFYAGLVSPDFTREDRRGVPQSSNLCGDCYSTQKAFITQMKPGMY
jgi:hypothetical protein